LFRGLGGPGLLAAFIFVHGLVGLGEERIEGFMLGEDRGYLTDAEAQGDFMAGRGVALRGGITEALNGN
jgi:hypothetical protein